MGTTESAADVAELCRRAEATGADSLWAVDHLYWPHPIAEPLTTLAVAATATTRPLLGTCVLQLPLRRPSVVAKQATALQLLSGGRFVLGVGVGIHEGEYEQAETDYHRRGHLMDEGVAKVRAAWASGGSSDYRMQPRSAPVPLWFGGHSDAARRRAALLGDGWIPLFLTPDDYAAALGHLRNETEQAGRDPNEVLPGVVVFSCVGDDDATERGAHWLSDLYRLPPKAFTRHLAAGSPEAIAERLHSYAEAGARHIVVMVAGSPAVEHFRQLHAAFAPEDRVLEGAPA
ncbi:MAG TPA: LLM class flavin-dependent oxidoreductase [Acidimicrobiales bacterium]|jgi:alkanesulfonate monooxygenase SsuD/methylene tetrahydromethanopterin reductase-like flavin-dependent oxidoreductase (luciferase family)